ncbi:MAG: glycosyltransferase family 39 protein [Phycisphaeraceae bacterium]|nr:glycosyltransferase family 39 protein [Phycisphaeraceae bacterium]
MRTVIALIVIVGALLPWFSIGDHPLSGRSEGRYGWTSVVMSRTGEWLVPMYLGHPHLTKPPMIYWMQAASVKVFGATEFAVRLPSAVAGSIAVVLVFVIGRRLWGARRGAIAAALYAVMPIHVVIARMAVTDSVLNVLWIGALAAGYRAVEARSRGWSVAMWGCVAAGLIVKGPVALIPVGVLIVWLALGGRWRETARLGFLIGVPIAVAPILAWVIAVVVRHPEAVDIWRHEMVDRATGAGDHARPFWYYLPVVLIGMFPATAMMTLPWFNLRWREAIGAVRGGDVRALMLVAVLVPVVVFTLIAGKLASYVLPCAIPLALLVSRNVEVWLTRDVVDGRRVPEIRVTLFVAFLCVLGVFAVALPYGFGAGLLWAILPVAGVAIVMLWAVLHWRRGTRARLIGLVSAWVLTVFSIGAAMEIEDAGLSKMSHLRLVRSAMEHLEFGAAPAAVTYGMEDGTLSFYLEEDVPRIGSRDLALLAGGDGALMVLTTPEAWARFSERWPNEAARFGLAGERVDWPTAQTVIVMGRPGAMDGARRRSWLEIHPSDEPIRKWD